AQVSRAGGLDESRSRQRMDRAEWQRGKVGRRRARREKAVERVARLERDLLAFVDFDDRRDVGMPAIVSGLRVIGQVPLAVDVDALHLRLLPRSKINVGCRAR